MVTVVVGGQFGDEGKGKIMSYLCMEDDPDVVVRGGVGPNAGHTVVVGGERYGVRQMPAGFANKRSRLLIGTGVLINPGVLLEEMDLLEKFNIKTRLGVDYRCTIIEKKHMERDAASDYLKTVVKTTGAGCGPANEDRVKRIAKRAEDTEELKPWVTDVSEELNSGIDDNKKILVEGTQGFALSVYYGTYPFVTSKDTTASAMLSDVGIGPTKVKDVITVFKAYTSRVGGGKLPTEDLEWAMKKGIVEYGTVTRRKRRIGKFDFELARRSVRINGATQLALTCIDILYPECGGAREYDDLSDDAKAYILDIESKLGVPIKIISTGPELNDTIDIRDD